MNASLQKSIFYLTGKPNLAQVQKEELESLLQAYPYFAPLQLAYVAKLHTIDTHKANLQLQKTGLYCTNQKWLQYQLMDASKFEMPVSNNHIASIEIPTIEAVKDLMNGVDKKEKQSDVKEISENKTDTELIENKQLDELVNQSPTTELINNQVFEEAEKIVEPTIPVYSLEKPHIIEHVIEKIEIVADEKINPNTIILDINTPIITPNVEEIAEKKVEEAIENNKIEVVDKVEEVEEVEEVSKSETTVQENIEAAIPSNDIHAQIAKLKEEWNKPIENKEEKFQFETEPYYTIDYFASQGIKFDLNKEPKDNLTTKMLRFTDWLKRMKSVKEISSENEEEEDTDIETAIVNIANVSNQPKEIVTETMAQVFEKQGKINKAIQLYIKLSFLNPDKSAYFATKIQELKGIKS